MIEVSKSDNDADQDAEDETKAAASSTKAAKKGKGSKTSKKGDKEPEKPAEHASEPVAAPPATDNAEKAGGGKGKKPDNLREEIDIDEHKLTLAQLIERYKVGVDEEDPLKSEGLSSEDAEQRLVEYGPNFLTPPPQVRAIFRFIFFCTREFAFVTTFAGHLWLTTHACFCRF